MKKLGRWGRKGKITYQPIPHQRNHQRFLQHRRPEFIAAPLQAWLTRVGVKPIQIYPGSPWENGYNERFNGTLRNEVLNTAWFSTTD